jgi:hypothetical protein
MGLVWLNISTDYIVAKFFQKYSGCVCFETEEVVGAKPNATNTKLLPQLLERTTGRETANTVSSGTRFPFTSKHVRHPQCVCNIRADDQTRSDQVCVATNKFCQHTLQQEFPRIKVTLLACVTSLSSNRSSTNPSNTTSCAT